jgi:hypothetical protein
LRILTSGIGGTKVEKQGTKEVRVAQSWTWDENGELQEAEYSAMRAKVLLNKRS